ncbi:hypothetical protein BC332_10551 [Capsicum chinense]|nr:hypothetical protein BC332_10551 [Capsicum chinense]
MNSLSKFVERFANMLCERLKKVQREGKSFTMLDFNMKITFDAMCDMLMSIKDVSLLEQIERDCTVVFDAMLSFPIAHGRLMETFKEMITARRNGKRYHEDFLQSRLDKDSFLADQNLDDEEIIDNLLTLIIAGQTTTAAAMIRGVKFLESIEKPKIGSEILTGTGYRFPNLKRVAGIRQVLEMKSSWIELYDSMVDKRDPEGEEEARKAYKAACEEDSDHTKERNVQHLLIGFTKCSKNLKRKSMIMMLRLVIVGGYWTAVGIAKNGIASDVHGSSNMHQPEDDLDSLSVHARRRRRRPSVPSRPDHRSPASTAVAGFRLRRRRRSTASAPASISGSTAAADPPLPHRHLGDKKEKFAFGLKRNQKEKKSAQLENFAEDKAQLPRSRSEGRYHSQSTLVILNDCKDLTVFVVSAIANIL